MSYEEKDPQNNKKNNFFNQNPLLVFAIFSVVVILIFKNFTAQSDTIVPSSFGASAQSVTKNINYYELKELIRNGQISQVAIGQTTIKAFSSEGAQKTIYLVKSRRRQYVDSFDG